MASSHDYLEIVIAEKLRLGDVPGSEITREQSKEIFVKVFPDMVNIHKNTGNPLDTLVLLTLCLQAKVSSFGILYAKASRRSIASELEISEKTIGLSLNRLLAHGFINRHVEKNNDATYLIFPNGGMEKFQSAKVRKLFLEEVARASDSADSMTIGARNPLPSTQDIVGGVETTPPPQSYPRVGVVSTPPPGKGYPTPYIEKEELEEKTTTTIESRERSSGQENPNSREGEEHACLDDPIIRSRVLELISDSQVISLNDDCKLELLQQAGQCWIVNQALFVLDANRDRIKSTPLKYLKGVIATIREEARDASPLAVRKWRYETRPFDIPGKKQKPETKITPLPTNPFSAQICKEAYEAFIDAGEEAEGWARQRFAMVFVDFDNYCLHMKNKDKTLEVVK